MATELEDPQAPPAPPVSAPDPQAAQQTTDVPVEDLVRQEASKQGIPRALALAVAEQESGFNPTLTNPQAVNGEHATGTFQLLPSTAKLVNGQLDLNNPQHNIQLGVGYLKQLMDEHHGDINQVLRTYGGVRTDTTYVPSVLARLARYQQSDPDDDSSAGPQLGAPPPVPPGWDDEHPYLKHAVPALQFLQGVGQGVGQTATNLGALVHRIPGVDRATDALFGLQPGGSQQAFTEAQQAVTPTSTPAGVGKLSEQMAELFAPAGAISDTATKASVAAAPYLTNVVGKTAAKLLPRMAVEGAGGAGLAAAQGGDPKTGAVLGAAIPVAGAVGGAATDYLKETAAKKVMQALGPTKERFKAIAQRIVPDVLQRGLLGGRASLVEQAAGKMDAFGQQIDDVLQQYGSQPISVQPVTRALEIAKDAFRTEVPKVVTTPAQQVATGLLDQYGKPLMRTIPGTTKTVMETVEYEPRAIRQLDRVQKIMQELGPTARVDQVVAVRRAWDTIVQQAGGFAHRATGAIGVPLADATEAAAKREATSAIRGVLGAAVPDLAALNKEYSFWKNLSDVTKQTLQRTQPQGPGLGQAIAEGAGRATGAVAGLGGGATGVFTGAYVGGQIMKVVNRTMKSPAWQLASGQVRDRLANAMANQSLQGVLHVAAELGVIKASQLGQPPPTPAGASPPPPPPPGLTVTMTSDPQRR